MRGQIGSFAVTWFLLTTLCGGSIYTYTRVVRTESQVQRLKQQLTIVRALSAGRSKADVTEWMGKPSDIFRDVMVGGRVVPTVLVYKSSPRRAQGTEDIWVALDGHERVTTVYYPDYPEDRINIERGR